jgi:vacuolar-type H+-ATPase subunit F/Vma7
VSILGKAEANFYIAQVIDVRTGSVNDLLTPGRNAKIIGNKLKVIGNDESCGVYFVNADTQEQVKVDAADIVENQNAHLIIIVPALSAGTYQLKITTQFTGSAALLKEPRTVVFDRPLTVS